MEKEISDARQVKCIESMTKSFMKNYFGRGPGLVRVNMERESIDIYCENFMTKLEGNIAVDDLGIKYIETLRLRTVDLYKSSFMEAFKTTTGISAKEISVRFDIENNNFECYIKKL